MRKDEHFRFRVDHRPIYGFAYGLEPHQFTGWVSCRTRQSELEQLGLLPRANRKGRQKRHGVASEVWLAKGHFQLLVKVNQTTSKRQS